MRTPMLLGFPLALSLLAAPVQAKDPAPVQTKDPALGATTFYTFESFLSPAQQPGEDADAPKGLSKAVGLVSTAPSVPRESRTSRGYGQIRFTRDLTRAYVDVQ